MKYKGEIYLSIVMLVMAGVLYAEYHQPKLGGLQVYYPDKTLTPGVMSSNPLSDICKNGTGKYRNVTDSTKKQVYTEYNVSYPQPSGAYEVDHWYPLGITGDNNIKNLWLMPAPQFHWKDVVETYLNKQVCSHQMTVPQAKAIIDTWYDFYQKNFSKNLGVIDNKDTVE